MLYFAILKGESQISKLLCRAGADPTKLGQGINALRLGQCTLAQFTYDKNVMRNFVGYANRMQRILRRFGGGVAGSPAKPAEEALSLANAGEAVSHGTEYVKTTKNLSDDSHEDEDEHWEEPSDSSSQSELEDPDSPFEDTSGSNSPPSEDVDTSGSSSSSGEDESNGSDVE